MITCDLRGQLGNQMFIAATVIAHALKMKTDFLFPERSGRRRQFEFMFPNLPSAPTYIDIFHSKLYKEPVFGEYAPLPEDSNLHLMGYFQSEKYFKDYRKEVIKLFEIPKYPINSFVSLHIRRGDSLKFINKLPQPTDKYLEEAISYFPDCNFLIFSDDINWCKQRFRGDRFFFSEGLTAKQDLGLMASCTHNIIVNSTFSWWGAWLNENPDKIVIVPHKDSWFGEAYKHKLSAEDIIPENWIQIKY